MRALAGLFLALAGTAAASAGGVVCRLEPSVLDVHERPGALIARIEHPALAADPGATLDGVFIASVAGNRLPGPDEPGEGIDAAAPRRGPVEALAGGGDSRVVRFDRPCDGDPGTRDDGDAGDLLAMLLDVPDGTSVPVCLGGTLDGIPFACCDAVVVRNRGLRDRPGRRVP
ncbi:MAG: hypothetical protein PVF68_13370 [Acidobacteriota bacterium]|jgi:hypothetical protein